jgi:hypothetical protein
MLDKRTTVLLDKINELCAEGSYKIVETEELLHCFPQKAKVDAEGLRHSLNYLRDHKYIDIKYAENGVYCLCPLPEGRMYFENAREAKTDVFRRRRDTVALSVIGAFFGGFLGSMIAWLIYALLLK